MSDVLAAVLGVSAGLVVLVFWGLAFMVILGWPLLAWSAVRSLRRIAHQLERANDYREHYNHGKPFSSLGS